MGYKHGHRLRPSINALLTLQRALDAHLTSDWLEDSTTSRGALPPINVLQQGEDLLAIIELPGFDKNDLQIQAKENTIRISGIDCAPQHSGNVRSASIKPPPRAETFAAASGPGALFISPL